MPRSQEVEILLVEDNEDDADLTIRSFEKHHLANKILWVKDGAEALDFIFGSGRYSQRNLSTLKVILLDLKLPKVDGLEILRRVKADESTRHVPVVVLTSSGEQQDMVQSYHQHANSYIVKPVDFQKFTQCLAQLGYYWLFINNPLSGH